MKEELALWLVHETIQFLTAFHHGYFVYGNLFSPIHALTQ